MIGGMGHSGMISLGVSLSKGNQVVCLDGDGSIMMHFGSLKTQGLFGKKNFKHILLNNFCHESVGKQKTYLEKFDFCSISKKLGYKYSKTVKDKSALNKSLKNFISSKGPSFLEIKIKVGTLKNLERPKDFLNIKENFIKD